METGIYPMQVQLRLFLDWGIRFKEPYQVPERAQRPVAYASKQALEEAIFRRHYAKHAESEPPQAAPFPVNARRAYPQSRQIGKALPEGTNVRTDADGER